MSYLIYRAVQKLWINKKIYMAVAFEIVIGITVVLCGILSTYSAKFRMDLYKQQIGENGVVIEYSAKESPNKELAITVEDYKAIKENYPKIEVSYLLYTYSVYQMQQSCNVKNVEFVSMDSDFFYNIFKFVPKENTLYLGKQITDDFESEELYFFETWLSWKSSGVYISDKYITNVERVDSKDKVIFVDLLIDLNIDSMIILPIECMSVLEENFADQAVPCLRIAVEPDSDTSDALAEIMQELQDRHPSYSYYVSEQYMELQKSITDLTQKIRLFAWVAWVVIAITVIGIIGILLIYMEKRKREFAIILALGGTHKTIFIEIFTEVFLLCFISGFIGLIISIIMLPYLSTSVFEAHFYWGSIAAMVGIVLMIANISCVCVISGIRNIYPIKILKE